MDPEIPPPISAFALTATQLQPRRIASVEEDREHGAGGGAPVAQDTVASNYKNVVISGGELFTVVDKVSDAGVLLFESSHVSCTLQAVASKCSGGVVHPDRRDTYRGCTSVSTSLLCCTHCHDLLGTCFFDANECSMKDCACGRVCAACFHHDDTKNQFGKQVGLGCKGCDFDCVNCHATKAAAYKAGCSISYCNFHPSRGIVNADTCIECAEEAVDFSRCSECNQVFCQDHTYTCETCHKIYCPDETAYIEFECSICFDVEHLCSNACSRPNKTLCPLCGVTRCLMCDMSYCERCYTSCCFTCAEEHFEHKYGSCNRCANRNR